MAIKIDRRPKKEVLERLPQHDYYGRGAGIEPRGKPSSTIRRKEDRPSGGCAPGEILIASAWDPAGVKREAEEQWGRSPGHARRRLHHPGSSTTRPSRRDTQDRGVPDEADLCRLLTATCYPDQFASKLRGKAKIA